MSFLELWVPCWGVAPRAGRQGCGEGVWAWDVMYCSFLLQMEEKRRKYSISSDNSDTTDSKTFDLRLWARQLKWFTSRRESVGKITL